LSTPPAFVLSQNQTLQTKTPHHQSSRAEFESEQVRPNKKTPKLASKKQATPPNGKMRAQPKKTTHKNHQTHY
ncbi:MAG: hypothetical protein ACXWZL_06220, partial [Mycobacterium sp.]